MTNSTHAATNLMAGEKPAIFPYVKCDCDPDGNFVCGDEEHALRLISCGGWPHGSMTQEQRRWCIQEADTAGEGYWNEAELVNLDDQELASAVIKAWTDYVRSNCM